MKGIADLKRAYRFFLYKSEAQKERTRRRKRSLFSKIRRKEDEIRVNTIFNKLYPMIGAYK